MRVTDLKLANVRSIKAAELRFQPGFNLVVGNNGAGKTTVLEALAVCVSEYVRAGARGPDVRPFKKDAIRIGAASLDVECGFVGDGSSHRFVLHKPRGQTEGRGKKGFIGNQPAGYSRGVGQEDGSGIGAGCANRTEPEGRPLGVLYSTARAVPRERPPRSLGARSVAYKDALLDREVGLGYFARWLSMKQSVDVERNQQALAAVQSAVRRFLPGYDNLRLGEADDPVLLIDRRGETLAMRQLSHGERGILAVMLDLTWRMGHLNSELTDPAGEAGAVVLIDEIDLHLHPKWQRQIARKLTETFPRCQFIATTHSPQVIGEIEHDRIQILTEDEAYSPTHSFGVDSSRILEEIMDANPRTKEVLDLLAQIMEEIDEDALARARESLNRLIDRVGKSDAEVTRVSTLLDFMEDK